MRIKNLAVLAALPLAMVACSGGGSGSGAGGIAGVVTPGSSINSQFIDAPVKGLKFEKDSGNGETADNGAFTCKAGELITFSVNDLEIGTVNCGEKIYISDLNPGVGNSTDAAAALIQSLSKTVGGVLDLSDFNAAPIPLAAIDLTDLGIDQSITDELTATITTLGLTKVTLVQAQAHVLENLPGQDDEVLESVVGSYTKTLEAVSGNNADHCWESVKVKFNVEGIDRGVGKPKAYRFNVTEYLAWDGTEPASPVCNGTEQGDDYQCIPNPIKKIITGRSVAGTHYEAYKFTIPAGETAICQHSQGYEFNYDDVDGVVCDSQDGETPLPAAKDLNIEINQGWNFGINVSASALTIHFTEMFSDIGAKLDAEQDVTDYVQTKYTCNYSLTEVLDLGESVAE